MPNSSVPKPGKRLAAFSCDHNKSFWLIGGELFEHVSVNYHDAIEPKVRPVYQEYPMCAVTQEGTPQCLCVFGVLNRHLNGFHINSRW